MSDWRIVQYILLRLLSSKLASIRNFHITSLTTKLKSWLKCLSTLLKNRENPDHADIEARAQQTPITSAAPAQSLTQSPSVPRESVDTPVGTKSQPAATPLAATPTADTALVEPQDNAASAGTEPSSPDALPGHQHDDLNIPATGLDFDERPSQGLNQTLVSSEDELRGLEESIPRQPLNEGRFDAHGRCFTEV